MPQDRISKISERAVVVVRTGTYVGCFLKRWLFKSSKILDDGCLWHEISNLDMCFVHETLFLFAWYDIVMANDGYISHDR